MIMRHFKIIIAFYQKQSILELTTGGLNVSNNFSFIGRRPSILSNSRFVLFHYGIFN